MEAQYNVGKEESGFNTRSWSTDSRKPVDRIVARRSCASSRIVAVPVCSAVGFQLIALGMAQHFSQWTKMMFLMFIAHRNIAAETGCTYTTKRREEIP
jgi:hypothetical protein